MQTINFEKDIDEYEEEDFRNLFHENNLPDELIELFQCFPRGEKLSPGDLIGLVIQEGQSVVVAITDEAYGDCEYIIDK